LARRPNVISNAGPTIPARVVNITRNFLVPSPRLLKLSNIFEMPLIIGVTACKNVFPIGAIDN
jgi:hypothetical protein